MRASGRLSGLLAGGLALAAAPPALAQVGVKAGLAFATLTESATPRDWNTQVGFTAGLAVRLPLLPPILSFHPELLYVEKGARVPDGGGENRIGYLDVSPLVRVGIPTPGIAPFVVAGPIGSLRAGCTRSVLRCDRLYRDFDAGVALGAGVRLRGWTIEGRWTTGLTNINAGDDGYDTRTRTILLVVGLTN